jgi:hypothetical protein
MADRRADGVTTPRVLAPHWAFAVAAVALLTGACGWFGDDIDFYGAYEVSPGVVVVELRACTIGNETAQLIETAESVELDDVTATLQPSGNDCSGVLQVELDEPLGERAFIVEGQRWVPYEGTCERDVTLVPPDVPDWFTNCG